MKNLTYAILVFVFFSFGTTIASAEYEEQNAFLESSEQLDVIVLVSEFRKIYQSPTPSEGSKKGFIIYEAKVVSSIKGGLKIGETLSYQFSIEEWPKWLNSCTAPLNSDLYLLAFDIPSGTMRVDEPLKLGDALSRVKFEDVFYKKLKMTSSANK